MGEVAGRLAELEAVIERGLGDLRGGGQRHKGDQGLPPLPRALRDLRGVLPRAVGVGPQLRQQAGGRGGHRGPRGYKCTHRERGAGPRAGPAGQGGPRGGARGVGGGGRGGQAPGPETHGCGGAREGGDWGERRRPATARGPGHRALRRRRPARRAGGVGGGDRRRGAVALSAGASVEKAKAFLDAAGKAAAEAGREAHLLVHCSPDRERARAASVRSSGAPRPATGGAIPCSTPCRCSSPNSRRSRAACTAATSS
jgi:hypothetical protein